MSNSHEFHQAIAYACQFLRDGNRHMAQQWAEHASVLDPTAEEPWLLLAETSNPRSSVGYAQRALMINPESEKAQRSLQSAMDRLARTVPAANAPAAESIVSTPDKPSKPASRRGIMITVLLIGLVSFGLLIAVTTAVSPAVASILGTAAQPTATLSAQFALADIAKPTFTPTPTVTPIPTETLLPTPTETPGLMEAVIVENIPAQSSTSLPSYSGNKYILVDISEQHMYVYEGDQLLYSFVASTGMNNATRTGLFYVQSKIPNAYGATWNIWMPHWLGIYWAGGLENGIHALPILPGGGELWAGYLGRPISYGCVVLGSYEATLLYDWAEIGTPVEIQW